MAGSRAFTNGGLVDYAASLDCIHCGLCLSSCPTFRLSGAESSSPRGRIHLMRAVGEDRLQPDRAYTDELDYCLLCRACESVCPAGVHFGEMMEFARDTQEEHTARSPLERFARWFGLRVLLPQRARLRIAGTLMGLAQRTGVLRMVGEMMRDLAGWKERGEGLMHLPVVPQLAKRQLLPEHTPAVGDEVDEVALLEGCVMPELFPHVNHATASSLAKLGVASHVPRGMTCCGSLHAHNGDLEGARLLAKRMIVAFEASKHDDGTPRSIVVNSAGCGAHMRECENLFDEDDPWHERAVAFSARVRDYSEVVAPLVAERELALDDLASPITWDDPCHLCHGQGVRAEPRAVLERVRGADRIALEDSEHCCGSAGIYSLLRPADSAAVFAPKLDSIEACGARTLVTANPGCQMQWQGGLARAGLDVQVLHLAEVVNRGLTPSKPELSAPSP